MGGPFPRAPDEEPPPELPPELRAVADAYQVSARSRGATHAGVGWSSRRAQTARFAVLVGLLDDDPAEAVSVVDLGCGYGALWPVLAERVRPRVARYTGYDIAPRMIRNARSLHDGDPRATFRAGAVPEEVADYGVCSGTFNYRGDTPAEAWAPILEAGLAALATRCRRGMAFNLLSTTSPRRLARMHYTEPAEALAIGRRLAAARGGTAELVEGYLDGDVTVFLRFPR